GPRLSAIGILQRHEPREIVEPRARVQSALKTIEGPMQQSIFPRSHWFEFDFVLRKIGSAAKLRLLKQSLVGQPAQPDHHGVAGECRETLSRRLAISRWPQG